MSTKTYDRNLRSPKFYSTAISGREGNNPEITLYYDSVGNLVRIEERMRQDRDTMHMWAQTVSGSGFAQNWPNYTATVVYNPWEGTTHSG